MELYSELTYKTSKLVTQTYSTSFSLAVGVLSPEMRRAIYSIYGFVRVADEIVDTFENSNQKKLLDKFETDYYEALNDKISTNPVIHSFVLTVEKYKIKPEHVSAFLASMRADLEKKQYGTNEELNSYIYGSADVVGLMCLMVFVNGNTDQYKALEKSAMKLGSAFQKVNFLRDLNNDVTLLNRTYFPQFEIATFDEKTKQSVIENIESDFKEARVGIIHLPGRSKLAVFIAYVYYIQLLMKIKATPAKQLIKKRIRISNSTKLFLLSKAFLQYKLNLI